MTKLLAFLVLVLFAAGCNTTDPPGETSKPHGYQEEINWPSLADTPWPVYQNNPQMTGRSSSSGPSAGVVMDKIPAVQMEAGISIGYDHILYYTSSGKVISADIQGSVKWQNEIAAEITSTPLIGKDSTIYVSSGSLRKVYAIDKDGHIKWEYESDYNIWNSTLGIDKAGNIYFIPDNNKLTALSNDGSLLWELYDNRFNAGYHAGFTFSPDGNSIYLQGNDVSVLAVDITAKNVKWTFGDRPLNSNPVVDNAGNIYLFPDTGLDSANYFYSLTPDGNIRWKYKHDETNINLDNIEPAIDRSGNIFFGCQSLYSLDYSGKLRWKAGLDGAYINTSLLVDKAGNVFIGAASNSSNFIISFDNNGNKNWEVAISEERSLQSGASISADGLLFYPTFRSNFIYVLR